MSPASFAHLRRLAARARARLSSRALILLYHRVAESISDPWSLAVKPAHFAEHLEVIKKRARVLSVEELVAAVADNNLPRRAIVITFDDGYADNFLNAKPLLEKNDCPATIFVTTGFAGSDREFWWDELDRLFLQPGALPSSLHLTIERKDYQWDLGEAASYGESAFHANEGWRAWQKDDPCSRHQLYRSLWELMHPLPDDERQRVRDDLVCWAGADKSPRATHRALSSDELGELGGGGLIEIGCHTITHPKLSALDVSSQRDEISQGKSRLEELLNRRIKSFAYPYGRPSDYTAETVAVVKEAGFDSACSTTNGLVHRRSSLFELPRFQAPDVDGEALDGLLGQWFDTW
ncbi:MAG TPA: polysaccharide deacetylase family protein [Blastocatellia bacterium]|nr:polysaccharide deacetylase family protein [Blastocatellia bacterium]